MGTHWFYCENVHEHGGNYRTPVDQIAETLLRKKLCQACYDKGFRLALRPIVIKERLPSGHKGVE